MNTVVCGDCLGEMKTMKDACVDLIYLDPPFATGKHWTMNGVGFSDQWGEPHGTVSDWLAAVTTYAGQRMTNYLSYMEARLVEMHRILKDTGSLYLHCDPTASHYLKIILDRVFGVGHCRNEIIWCYHGPGSPKMRQFNRKTDTIFWYSKGETWTFNADAVREPYKNVKQHLVKRFSPAGTFTQEEVERNRLRGKVPENWWEIRIAARSKTEYTGYPTQKPLALLRRIIQASSKPGDVVLDPFCGSGTTCVAAQQLGRKWIGIDKNPAATAVAEARVKEHAGLFADFAIVKT